MDGGTQALEEGELHGGEGQIAGREGGVTAPELGGVFVEFLEGQERSVGLVAAAVGRGGGRGVDDHLGVLLEDFGGGKNKAGD